MTTHDDARRPLLAELPVEARRLELAGVSTVLFEGGEGPPTVLLHGPAANAAHWFRVIPGLVTTHRVVIPDLPGHGASEVLRGALDADGVLKWLGELIESTCASPPFLVGHAAGGAIALRFAGDHGDRLAGIVLVDALGLTEFDPAPEFGAALHDFLSQPTEESHDGAWQYCAHDLDRMRRELGEHWESFKAYNLDRARTPGVIAAVGSLMEQFGIRAIPPAELARIAVPTALIWGRHDLATRLSVAEAASARYGWPLYVIEEAADDPPIEQPEAFLRVLRTVLGVPSEAAA
jgi:pimeloyl-ACP methyl ester carboxylesterase